MPAHCDCDLRRAVHIVLVWGFQIFLFNYVIFKLLPVIVAIMVALFAWTFARVPFYAHPVGIISTVPPPKTIKWYSCPVCNPGH